jgi:hypothetical protein
MLQKYNKRNIFPADKIEQEQDIETHGRFEDKAGHKNYSQKRALHPLFNWFS